MLTAGARLGPYDILALVGSGGMGEVYRAHDARLGRDVAIKVLPAAFADDPDRLRRFEQEARAAAALNHPNILHILDIGRDGPTAFVVSELLEGETLRAQMEGSALPLSKAVDCARQIALGLAAAHAKGITHRDIKPENFFVMPTAGSRSSILAWPRCATTRADGGATRLRSSTEAGVVLGTFGYMSPEQVRAQPVDGRSDIFSAGVVLFEMVAGSRPFQGDSAVETMNAILKDDPPDLAVAHPKLPASVGRIIGHCREVPVRALPIRARPGVRARGAVGIGRRTGSHDRERNARRATVSVAPVGPLGDCGPHHLWTYRNPAACCQLSAASGGRSSSAAFSDRTPRKLDLPGQLDMDGLAVSPDGRRVAFVAVSEGVRKLWVRVYVTRFGSPDRDIQRVSTAGGRSPSWRRDQKGLVFLGADSTIMSVTLKPGATLQCSTPSPLFRSALMVDNSFDVAGDAQHFVVVTGSAQSLTSPFTVVANCQAA